MKTAVNPETGERLMLVNGSWEPVAKTAVNPDTGQRVGLVGGKWVELSEPKGPTDFSALEMVKNIPGSAYRYGEGIVDSVIHPVRTAKAVGGLAQSLGNKLGRTAAEIVQGEEMESMPERSEEIANLVGRSIKDRYGSVDALQNTLMTDPVGALADVSGAAMATKLPGVARVGAALEPANVAAKGLRSGVKAAIPKGKAQDLYQSSAKFSTVMNTPNDPNKRARVIQTALDEGVMPTESGVAQVRDRIDILNAQMDDMIMQADRAGVTIPADKIYQHLDDLRRTKGGVRAGAQDDLRAIDKMRGDLDEHLKFLGKAELTPSEMQFFKQEAYKDINWDAKRLAGTPIKEETLKAMARGAKDAIVEAFPEAADTNKQLSALYELQKPLMQAAGRIGNRNLISLNTPLRAGAGGVIGEIMGSGKTGVAVGAALSAIGNPKVKARVAIVLNKLEQGDVDWLKANRGLAEVRIALTLVDRLQDEISDQQTNQ